MINSSGSLIKKSAKRRSRSMVMLKGKNSMPLNHYLWRSALKRHLSGWFIWTEATTPSDIAAQTALHERHLQPCVKTLNRYKTSLSRQARDEPVATPRVDSSFSQLAKTNMQRIVSCLMGRLSMPSQQYDGSLC